MSIKRVYKASIGSSQYLFANGKSAHFVDGRYETDIADEIQELDEQINRYRVPHIFIDPNDATRDTGLEDFLREKQKQATVAAIKEYEEKQAAKAANPDELPEVDPAIPVQTDPNPPADAEVVKTVDTNLAKLLSTRRPDQNGSVGIANSDNAPKG